jgi:hypothetical protein
MKTIKEPWWKFFSRFYWQIATSDPDLIYIAPCMILMGFIAPLIFRLLALVIAPVMIGLGSVLFVVAVGQKLRQLVKL